MNGRRSRKGNRFSSNRASELDIYRKDRDVLSTSAPNEMPSTDQQDLVTPQDFQALGLRPNECRVTIIRSAAARSTRSLADCQLNPPSPSIDAQLCHVVHSAYRLMDPRKRSDSYQRSCLGRILPTTLLGAGRTRFAAGNKPTTDSLESPILTFEPTLSELSRIGELEMATEVPHDPLVSLANGLTLDNHFTKSLDSGNILHRGVVHRSYLRLRAIAVDYKTPIAASVVILCSVFLYNFAANQPTGNSLPAPSPAKTSVAMTTDPTADSAELPNSSAVEIVAEPQAVDFVASASTKLDSPKAESTDRQVVASEPQLGTANPVELVENNLADAMPTVPSDPLSTDPLSTTPLSIDPLSTTPLSTGLLSTSQKSPERPLLAEVPTMDLPSLDVDMLAERAVKETSTEFLQDPFADLAMSPSAAPSPNTTAKEPTVPSKLTDSVLRLPPPSQKSVELVEQRLRRSISPLQRSTAREDVETVLASLTDLAKFSDEASTEYWAATLLAAKTQWIAHNAEQVQQTLMPMVDHFDVSIDELMVQSFIGTQAFREDMPNHSHRINEGFRLLDDLLVNEKFSLAGQVSNALENSIRFVDNEEQTVSWRELSRATEQMKRMQQSVASLIKTESIDSVSGSQAAIAGRYLCLMQYRWKDGIAWMATGSDARLSPLARQEVVSLGEASANEKVELAQRWMAASTRETGRAAQSMLLHAQQLFQVALENANAVEKIELEQQMADIDAKLPAYLSAPYRSSQFRPAPIAGEPMPTAEEKTPQLDKILEFNSDSALEVSEPDESNSGEFYFPRAITTHQRPHDVHVSTQPMIWKQLPVLGHVNRRLRPIF